jgi:hypothetical protein
MRRGALLWLAVLAVPLQVGAGQAERGPALDVEHVHPSKAFRFRTPASWKVEPVPGRPDLLEARGDGVRVRFLFQRGENGLDAMHAACLDERLAGPMETDPGVKYEYDFVEGQLAGRGVLDSAFTVRYDKPIDGEREWRQRNVTLVGAGQSLCVMAYAPQKLWKKSAETRRLLDAVLASLSFPAPPAAQP